MNAKYINPGGTFVPACTGEVINVGPDDTEMLRFLFGEYAEEMVEMLRRPRPANQYVQVAKPPTPEDTK